MPERDLLSKHLTPLIGPDATSKNKKHDIPTALDRLGIPRRPQDLGGTEDSLPLHKASTPLPAEVKKQRPADKAEATDQATSSPHKPLPAYQSSYFSQDIEETRHVNQRSQPMRQLRGSEEAVDLKKTVLPPPLSDASSPNPEQLMTAGDLMDLHEEATIHLTDLLSRQGGWTQARGVTPELLQNRLAQLEAMVQARRSAIKRLGCLNTRHLSESATLQRALQAKDEASPWQEDWLEEGNAFISQVRRRAHGMRRRLSKALGTGKKRNSP